MDRASDVRELVEADQLVHVALMNRRQLAWLGTIYEQIRAARGFSCEPGEWIRAPKHIRRIMLASLKEEGCIKLRNHFHPGSGAWQLGHERLEVGLTKRGQQIVRGW